MLHKIDDSYIEIDNIFAIYLKENEVTIQLSAGHVQSISSFTYKRANAAEAAALMDKIASYVNTYSR